MQNYVKFLRGTPTAYANSAKDKDTLYFISEPNATSGKLYLGEKLISCSITADISRLEDVLAQNDIEDGSILTYDADNDKWVATSQDEILSLIVVEMEGATEEDDGRAGLVPAPSAGDQVKFLRGDGSWVAIADVSGYSDLQATVATLVGEDADKSARAIAAEEVAKLVAEAPEDFDTLKEIADWIQSHPSDVSEINTRLQEIESAVSDTEVKDAETGEVISTTPGLVSKVASLDAVLNGSTSTDPDSGETVTTEGLVSVVNTLQTTINNITGQDGDLAAIIDALTWKEIHEDGTIGER